MISTQIQQIEEFNAEYCAEIQWKISQIQTKFRLEVTCKRSSRGSKAWTWRRLQLWQNRSAARTKHSQKSTEQGADWRKPAHSTQPSLKVWQLYRKVPSETPIWVCTPNTTGSGDVRKIYRYIRCETEASPIDFCRRPPNTWLFQPARSTKLKTENFQLKFKTL